MSRSIYWISQLIVLCYFAVSIGLIILSDYVGLPAIGAVFAPALFIPVLWMSLAIQIKRWHDRDKPGAMMLVNFIPFVGGIWAFIELGLLRGTPGVNEYGPNPLD